jgi:hypothetical protein
MTLYTQLARKFLERYRAWEKRYQDFPLSCRPPVNFGGTPLYPQAAVKLYGELVRNG